MLFRKEFFSNTHCCSLHIATKNTILLLSSQRSFQDCNNQNKTMCASWSIHILSWTYSANIHLGTRPTRTLEAEETLLGDIVYSCIFLAQLSNVHTMTENCLFDPFMLKSIDISAYVLKKRYNFRIFRLSIKTFGFLGSLDTRYSPTPVLLSVSGFSLWDHQIL